ncbi:hypothetical protein BLNAU_10548 [Blattamonas nauphoetae]|uniref:non-specific serine/threonine protein kinase n=1 Tax=Blattamonas nauphoetae TaxID=2049346 RepID=A0ABQ9XS78_9EUKA|nr:hypothetical protein BLNAU_10548 [Blattamonas nauphoetae]
MSSKLDDVTPPGYTPIKRISEGAFGQVLKVLHERSGVEYAMKVLPMLKEGDKEKVSREVISVAPLSQQTSTIGEMGTFEYNSPERVMDSKGLATPASDVWSLGVLAYRMVTGRPLFEDLTLPQLCRALDHFSGSMIPTTIPSPTREILLKMLEPNVALRANTAGLLESMLGPETALSKMKNLQLVTRVNEIKESSSDAQVKEKTMELEMEKQKMLEETKELESQLRSVQMSLQRTCLRNDELGKEEELEEREHLLATPSSRILIDSDANVLGKTLQLSYHIISEGVVSLAITILSKPDQLMFGLVDALSWDIKGCDQLGVNIRSSFAIDPGYGILHYFLPSTKQEITRYISPKMRKGDKLVLEVDMDARPRTAVFIINGNVSLTFVSGLPPSIQFGLSMKNEVISVRFDGMSRLKQATPLRRVNEVKWNRPELRDNEVLYMNGMRFSVLTIQTQMTSLVFTDPSHFRVGGNIVSYTSRARKEEDRVMKPTWSSFFISEPITEGIVAISFTYLMDGDGSEQQSSFGLIDGTSPIPQVGEQIGMLPSVPDSVLVEINMDSDPRTAQFFVGRKSCHAVVVDLPESVRVGFSATRTGMQVRFDRITNLRVGSQVAEQMKVVEWPTPAQLQATESKEDGTNETNQRVLPTMKLPELLFTHKSHFFVRNSVLTRTEKGDDGKGKTRPSTVLLSEPITKGVVSVTFVVLTLAESGEQKGIINFGLLDSSLAVPQLGRVLGKDVQLSLSLSTSEGNLLISNRSSSGISGFSGLSKNDRVVMEVNMDSTPRTVQFFKNGWAGKCYVSGIPESVRIGFSADVMGTSLQITSIIHSTQPTPLTDHMKEIKCTDTEQSLKERSTHPDKPIRREAEGSMPPLLSRNLDHFLIEGNVITLTYSGSNGLNTSFSTVMFYGLAEKSIKSLKITILALPQTGRTHIFFPKTRMDWDLEGLSHLLFVHSIYGGTVAA